MEHVNVVPQAGADRSTDDPVIPSRLRFALVLVAGLLWAVAISYGFFAGGRVEPGQHTPSGEADVVVCTNEKP